jgi:uncharacterized protein YndB with AHSA1/START domain
MATRVPVKALQISRHLAAPPSLVWKAWTEVESFRQWMGPVGWDITDCTIDLRPGGRWSTTQRDPSGGEHPTGGSYLAIDPPRYLAFNWILTDPSGKVVMEAEHHLTFVPRDAGTDLTMDIRIMIAEPGSEGFTGGVREGWTGTLGKLATFVER